MPDHEHQRQQQKSQDEAEKHAEETGVPEGSTPEAVREEEESGGALTNRGSESGADEAEDPPSPS